MFFIPCFINSARENIPATNLFRTCKEGGSGLRKLKGRITLISLLLWSRIYTLLVPFKIKIVIWINTSLSVSRHSDEQLHKLN